jgi:hypothetical protein
LGKEAGFGIPIPIDLTYPPSISPRLDVPGKARQPTGCCDNGIIRFKFALDGKYEVVRDNSPILEHSTDIKWDPLKGKVSATVGVKAQITSTLEASANYKFNSSIDEMVSLLKTDRARFKYALLRNLDVVFGKNFKIRDHNGNQSAYLKSVGVALTFDPDFCFFGILIPLTIPIFTTDAGDGKVKGRVTANLIFKFGPTKRFWAAIFRQLGGRAGLRWLVQSMQSVTKLLPSEAAKVVGQEAEQFIKTYFGDIVATEASLFEGILAWVGVYSIALPIALALTDFMIYVTRSARQSGVRDGDLNQFASTYVYTVYGMDIPAAADARIMAVKRAAIDKARNDVEQYGRDSLQQYLEKSFNNSHRLADASGVVRSAALANPMAERMWLQLRKQYN